MSFIIKFWKKVLYLLITGSTSIFIAACYGMPVGFGDLGTWTIRTKNKDNQPIEGLDVSVLQFVGNAQTADTLDVQKTDSTGTVMVYLTTYDKDASHRHEAIIRDTDENENGGLFRDTLITKGLSEESVIQMKIKQ